MQVEDTNDLNDVVKKLKSNPEVCIQIQPLKNMQMAVVTDASCGNDGHHSQKGQIELSLVEERSTAESGELDLSSRDAGLVKWTWRFTLDESTAERAAGREVQHQGMAGRHED